LYRGKYASESRQYYAAMVTHADDAVGRVLGALDRQGIAEDTLVIFFSDNGAEPPGKKSYIFPDPAINTTTSTERYGDSGPLRGFKFQLYEGGVRVPAFAYWPGKLKPKKNNDTLAIYDILPTVAALTGSPIPKGMTVEGLNFWPSVAGDAPVGERVIYWNCEGLLGVRKGDWKLIHFDRAPGQGKQELYNIAKDPYEKQDRISDQPCVAAALQQELLRQYAKDSG
jgi:arylsulfatase A-like enzyme